MTDVQLFAALGWASYGPCPYCGVDRIGPSDSGEAAVARAHNGECHVHLAAELEALLDSSTERADVAEYARLKATDDPATADRRWELRDRIHDHLAAGGYDVDTWFAWFRLADEPWESEAEADDPGMAALRVAGLL
jgi:hypothetical protein